MFNYNSTFIFLILLFLWFLFLSFSILITKYNKKISPSHPSPLKDHWRSVPYSNQSWMPEHEVLSIFCLRVETSTTESILQEFSKSESCMFPTTAYEYVWIEDKLEEEEEAWFLLHGAISMYREEFTGASQSIKLRGEFCVDWRYLTEFWKVKFSWASDFRIRDDQ